ncbi:MAG: rubrerythrin family protein [archaeon]
MGKTDENLKAAFAGESQANRAYLAFAKRAEKDGKKNIANMFRAIAEAETVHAHNHLGIMNGVKDTKENLKKAIEGEAYEHQKMYPEFMKNAKEEKNDDAWKTFNWANEVEKIHEGLFRKALETFESGGDIRQKEFYVCPVCGYTHESRPGRCPLCGTDGSKFMVFGG